MNRYYFKSLDRSLQFRYVRMHGRMLHRRLKGEYMIRLYQLKNFYVEVWCSEARKELDDLVTFKDRALLNYPYNLNGTRQSAAN